MAYTLDLKSNSLKIAGSNPASLTNQPTCRVLNIGQLSTMDGSSCQRTLSESVVCSAKAGWLLLGWIVQW